MYTYQSTTLEALPKFPPIHRKKQRRSINHRSRKKPFYITKYKYKLLEHQNNKCFWCHKQIDFPTTDHVVPIRCRGRDEPENFVVACKSCNEERGRFQELMSVPQKYEQRKLALQGLHIEHISTFTIHWKLFFPRFNSVEFIYGLST